MHVWCTLKTPPKGRIVAVMYNMASTLARSTKRGILLFVDIILVPPALLTAMVLQYDDNLAFDNIGQHWLALPLLMVFCGLLTVVLGLHRVQLKAFESHAIGLTALHAVLLGLATAVMDDLAGFGTSFATFINFALIYFFMSIGVRMLMLQILLAIYRRAQPQCRLLIYGAGQTGRQLAAALRTDQTTTPVAFVDDNEALQTTLVQGLTVYSPSQSRPWSRLAASIGSSSRCPRWQSHDRRNCHIDCESLGWMCILCRPLHSSQGRLP